MCYKFYDSHDTWAAARKKCQTAADDKHGDLASVPDNKTNQFIRSLAKKRSMLGGLIDEDNNWSWADGTFWKYEQWAVKQPSGGEEKYLELFDPESGDWNDVAAEYDHPHGYICQYKGEDFHFTIVLYIDAVEPCKEGWRFFKHTGKCYIFIDSHLSWQGAQQFCKNYHVPHSAGLASVVDNETNIFLTSLSNKRALLGGYLNDDGEWIWVDGSYWKFEHWAEDQPSGGEERFLELFDPESGTWNDVPDEYPNIHGFICQYGI